MMEERWRVLVSLSASVAANCVPCFQHYYKKSREVGLTDEEIHEAVEIGNKMKTGAMMAVRNNISEILGSSVDREGPGGSPTCERSCCG